MYDVGFRRVVAVTNHDSNDITEPNNGLIVTVGGNAVIVPANGSATLTFTALTAGTYLPFKVKRVNSTGTTASFATLYNR